MLKYFIGLFVAIVVFAPNLEAARFSIGVGPRVVVAPVVPVAPVPMVQRRVVEHHHYGYGPGYYEDVVVYREAHPYYYAPAPVYAPVYAEPSINFSWHFGSKNRCR